MSTFNPLCPPQPVATPVTSAQQEPCTSGPFCSEHFLQHSSIVYDARNFSRQPRGGQVQGIDVEGGRKSPPRNFLFCFPWVKSRKVRSQILTCFVSGMFLASLLAVYLGLALTSHIARGELTIMIILVILSATIFFGFSVIRLCTLIARGDRARRRIRAEMLGLGGYVVPQKPIPVVLAQDEEAVGVESEASKSRPPAYGLWRESIPVDPNRIFWQRNEAASTAPQRLETRTGPRPPSYASEDGVSYVVDARQRSMTSPPHAHAATVSSSNSSSTPRI